MTLNLQTNPFSRTYASDRNILFTKHLTYSSKPQEIATVNVEGKSFKVQKALLVKDSEYFEKALSGPFLEGQTQTINLDDDISAPAFGFYVDILFRSYFTPRFILHFHDRRFYGLLRIARLWNLANRFLNQQLLNIAQESLDSSGVLHFTVTEWESFYRTSVDSDSALRARVHNLQTTFNYCVKHRLAIKEDIVGFSGNMPVQLFSKHHDELDVDFRSEVLKKLLKRLENPKLKRPGEEPGGEGSPAAKRRRQH